MRNIKSNAQMARMLWPDVPPSAIRVLRDLTAAYKLSPEATLCFWADDGM